MRVSWKVVPALGGLAIGGACAADRPLSPGGEGVAAEAPAAAPATLTDGDRAALVAAGLADVETRVLPTLGEEGAPLRAAVAAMHGALDRRDATALARGIAPVLAAARVLALKRADLAYELEPLTASLAQASEMLPATLRSTQPEFTITTTTRGER